MKIRIASDLHLEFLGEYITYLSSVKGDWNSYDVLARMDDDKEQTLFLAGDIIMLMKKELFIPFFNDISDRFKEVFIICGNHEFYRTDFQDGRTYVDYDNFIKRYWANITLLQDSWEEREDFVIFGATLWTGFDNRDPLAMMYAPTAMSDFRVIQNNGAIWTPEMSVVQHHKTLERVEHFFALYNDSLLPRIVMTHHLPSPICSDPRYKGSKLNPAFLSNLDSLIDRLKPKMWICGHTHHSLRTMLYDTEMVINPRGYNNGAENPSYNDKLVIGV